MQVCTHPNFTTQPTLVSERILVEDLLCAGRALPRTDSYKLQITFALPFEALHQSATAADPCLQARSDLPGQFCRGFERARGCCECVEGHQSFV